MVPAPCTPTAPVPSPAYQRTLAKHSPALHVEALSVVQRLHLLALCRLAVGLAQGRTPAALPRGQGGAPRLYSETVKLQCGRISRFNLPRELKGVSMPSCPRCTSVTTRKDGCPGWKVHPPTLEVVFHLEGGRTTLNAE